MLRSVVMVAAPITVVAIVLIAVLDRQGDSPNAATLPSTPDVHITEPGGSAPGAPINLSSYTAALASLATNDVVLSWPGADSLGDRVISGASITVSAPTSSISIQGPINADGFTGSALLILDWTPPSATPTISLGFKGALDMAMLNPAWKLEGSAFTIDGFAAITTGEQTLTGIAGATAFYGDVTTLSPGIQIKGGIQLGSLLPGVGANASTLITVSATLDADIGALLADDPLKPADPGKVSFAGTIAASNLKLPVVPGLTATAFNVQVDLEGGDNDAATDFDVTASGEFTIDDDAVSTAPVTFDVQFDRQGGISVLSGGVKSGSSWTNPFGAPGITISELRMALTVPAGDATPTLSLKGNASIGGVGVAAEITANDEVAATLTIESFTVDQAIALFDTIGFTPGTMTAINDEVGNLTIGPTSIRLETEAGQVTGALSTGVTFRSKTATLLLAGGTGPDAGLMAAIQLPSFTIGDLWPAAPSAIKAIALPEGGFTISSADIEKTTYEAGGIEDTFLSAMYCSAGTPAEVTACDYTVPTGISLAAQITLDPGLRTALAQLGPLANTPVRIEGTLPVFGGTGGFHVKLTLPKIVPTPGSGPSGWLTEARLTVDMTVTSGNLTVKLQGAMDTKLPDETEVGGVDHVTFTVDAAVQLGTSGVKVTLGAAAGPWATPFGVDWIDLNGLRLEVVISAAPQPGVQIGVAAAAQIKSACAIFTPGPSCPAPTTVEASFAIGVKVATPVQVDFGLRLFASQIALKDVAAVAKQMGADIDPASLPDASLRNVEFAFSTIDAPSLCLSQGLTVGADLFLDTPTIVADPIPVADRTLCSPTDISPAEGVANCQADPSCMAHLRIKVSDAGITASAAIGTIDFSPVVISNAALTLSLTETDQSFHLSGDVKIVGFASVKGSVDIMPTGFAFSLSVDDDTQSGDKFVVEGSASFNTDDPGFEFHLRIFLRLPSVNEAFLSAQGVLQEVATAFGSPIATTYSLRCVEFSADLVSSATDPVSGQVSAKIHFSAIDNATHVEDGKLWQLGWDFDASLATNVSNLVGSLSGNTSQDDAGCGIDPGFSRIHRRGVPTRNRRGAGADTVRPVHPVRGDLDLERLRQVRRDARPRRRTSAASGGPASLHHQRAVEHHLDLGDSGVPRG